MIMMKRSCIKPKDFKCSDGARKEAQGGHDMKFILRRVEPRIKISVIMDILVFGFYRYIGYIDGYFDTKYQ